jgi:sulfur carrier protein
MKLHLNGVPVEFEESLTLSGLLERHRLKPEAVVVEYNLQIPSKNDYACIEIRDGDRIEILKFMGGG